MSSSGMVRRSIMTSTTGAGEGQRQLENAQLGSPDSHEETRIVTGAVAMVHPTKGRYVKAYTPEGERIANGSWIELIHSADEIAERWGTIRIGFRVKVTLMGMTGDAHASVIGTEDQNLDEPAIPNEVERGLFGIFAPGSGIG